MLYFRLGNFICLLLYHHVPRNPTSTYHRSPHAQSRRIFAELELTNFRWSLRRRDERLSLLVAWLGGIYQPSSTALHVLPSIHPGHPTRPLLRRNPDSAPAPADCPLPSRWQLSRTRRRTGEQLVPRDERRLESRPIAAGPGQLAGARLSLRPADAGHPRPGGSGMYRRVCLNLGESLR